MKKSSSDSNSCSQTKWGLLLHALAVIHSLKKMCYIAYGQKSIKNSEFPLLWKY